MADKIITEDMLKLKETLKSILKYKIVAEANIVATIWKSPQILYDHTELKLEDFTDNMWRVYWQIANDITMIEKKEVLSVLDGLTTGRIA